jgi:ATP synthase F1 complex assembly factor 1
MRRLPLRLLRPVASALRVPAAAHGGLPATPALHPAATSTAPSSLPADLSRWPQGRAYSQFASGFTPLKPKPLESIIDIERAKALSPEDLVAAWDNVSPCPSSLVVSFVSIRV